MIARHAVAALTAVAISLRHARALGITASEAPRYLRKSFNLALCYVGFGTSGHPREAWQAGRVAFLSTAFDVATDWRRFDPAAIAAFERILMRSVTDVETRRLALELLDAKRTRAFGHDGLERGVPAVVLILRVMGCLTERRTQWGDLAPIGETLQLIDDILDFDLDIATGDANCLVSPRAGAYLDAFIRRETSGDFERWFERGTVLHLVAQRALTRARTLRGTLPTAEESDPAPGRDAQRPQFLT
jgi:hypothetical protein